MIRINLLDYREELERVAVQKKTVASLCVISGFILLIVVVWIQKQGQIITVQEEALAVQEKVNALESQVRAIRKMKVRKRRADQIIEGIEKLRKEQASPSELLGNLSEKIPKGLWLDAIRQVDKKFLKKKNIQILWVVQLKKKLTELSILDRKFILFQLYRLLVLGRWYFSFSLLEENLA